jgi:hypothetical protein
MKSILILVYFLISPTWSAQEIGNGGGFVLCKDNNYYQYDYAFTFKNPFGPAPTGLNFNQRIQFISFHLKRLGDPLLNSFNEFMSSLYTQNVGKKHKWFKVGTLPLMWEPDLETYLPKECKPRKQAVVFFAAFNQIPYSSYKYDGPLLQRIEAQPEGSLQTSYLWVHEWLWNYFERTEFIKLAQLNRLLNSQLLGTITPQNYQKIRGELLKSRARR